MVAREADATTVLVTVLKALEPLNENDRRWVLQAVADRWTSITLATAAPSNLLAAVHTGAAGPRTMAGNTQDAKTFVRTKDPKSDLQRIAVLAYYLTHGKDTPAFKTRDLTAANTEARGPKFHIPRAVANAARAKCGYLSAVGGGKKQLSAYGEEIVEALPDQEAVKTLEAKYKKGKRRKSAKKGSRHKA